MPKSGLGPRPLATEITLPCGIPETFTTVVRHPFPFLLESALPSERSGRHTILGSNPFLVLLSKGDRITIWKAGHQTHRRGNPFDTLAELLDEHRVTTNDRDLPFVGGAVGYLGYDLGQHLEKLPRESKDDLDFPDMFLAFHDRLIVIDHGTGRSQIVELDPRDKKRAMDLKTYLEFFTAPPRPPIPRTFEKADYLAAIAKAKEYIADGDIYQVNLSQRFEADVPIPPFDVYVRLREISPAPYAAYLEMGGRAVLSSSPELFIEARDGRVRTRPIKGTRRRGADPAEDERLRRELLDSPKDDAELAMIVDLERNDLGRVCEYGSVRVAEAKTLETLPGVHHLSATIEGRLKGSTVDLLRAVFPGGSVTGAPKIRAMEIIDELEPTRRGAYTGAIGYLGFDGAVSLSVAIRVLHADGRRYSFQSGGAIVADSDPEAEYDETLVKAAGMARALGLEWKIGG